MQSIQSTIHALGKMAFGQGLHSEFTKYRSSVSILGETAELTAVRIANTENWSGALLRGLVIRRERQNPKSVRFSKPSKLPAGSRDESLSTVLRFLRFHSREK